MPRDIKVGNLWGFDEGSCYKICSSGEEEQMVRICLYVYVCVALPMIVAAWSMAVVLWQLYEYYVDEVVNGETAPLVWFNLHTVRAS